MDKDFDIIVVGSGHNGLVAANYLGAANYSVLLTERRPIIGGACITEELFPGYKFSACSYICYLLQDKIIDDLQLRDHGFDIYPINPSRFQPFPSGSRILLWDDVQKRDAVNPLEGAEATGQSPSVELRTDGRSHRLTPKVRARAPR